MTILSTEKILPQPRDKLWEMASHFDRAARWIDGMEKAEHVSGEAANLGGVWRVCLRWDGSYQIIDIEITEWMEGERFGLRPLSPATAEGDAELYQIVFNLKALVGDQTQVTVQCASTSRAIVWLKSKTSHFCGGSICSVWRRVLRHWGVL